MKTGAELLREARAHIKEVTPVEVNQMMDQGVALIDCREVEEIQHGMLPGAIHIPRSYLETRIESAVSDRSQPIVLYCASGVRSALGAFTLQEEMGYESVSSMSGGFVEWKDLGYQVHAPRAMSPQQRERYSRHILIPEVGAEGQHRLLDSRVLLLGAGGLGSPVALYLAAAGVGTIGIVDSDTVDLSNLQRQVIHSAETLEQPKVESAEQAIKA